MAKNPDVLTEDAALISAADARPAMNLEQTSPPPPLRDCIRCFQQRRANIRGTPTVYPIAARPDQFLEFYLQDPYIVRIGDGAAPEIVPHSVVVGPSTQRRAQLVLRGKLDVFTIQFRVPPAVSHADGRVCQPGFRGATRDWSQSSGCRTKTRRRVELRGPGMRC